MLQIACYLDTSSIAMNGPSMLRTCCWASLLSLMPFAAAVAEIPSSKEYLPQWYSLDQHQTPQWLQDAKVGLFVYPLGTTEEQFNAYKARHGELHKYNSPDGWDITPWDPEAIAQLAQDAID